MVFRYDNRLSARQQSIYRQSDEIKQLRLPDPAGLQPIVAELEPALKSGNHREIERLSQIIQDTRVTRIKGPTGRIQLLALRPMVD